MKGNDSRRRILHEQIGMPHPAIIVLGAAAVVSPSHATVANKNLYSRKQVGIVIISKTLIDDYRETRRLYNQPEAAYEFDPTETEISQNEKESQSDNKQSNAFRQNNGMNVRRRCKPTSVRFRHLCVIHW